MTTTTTEQTKAPTLEELQAIVAETLVEFGEKAASLKPQDNSELLLSFEFRREFNSDVFQGDPDSLMTTYLRGWAARFLECANKIEQAAGFKPGFSLYVRDGHERRVSCAEFPDVEFVVCNADSDTDAVDKARSALAAMMAGETYNSETPDEA